MATPTLSKVIEDAIDAKLYGLHTMLPGKVSKVDVAKGKCDVQPLLMRQKADGTVTALPPIPNCPIASYRAGKSGVFLPVKVGDYVEIRFCERSLDVWLSKGGTIDPADRRKHNLSDAVVYPGLYPFSDPPVSADPANLVVVNDKAKITEKPTGEIVIDANAGQSKITLKADGTIELTGATAIKALSDLIVLSGDGDAVALASKVMTELNAIRSTFNSHTHNYMDATGAAGTPVPQVTQAPSAMAAPGEVKSTKVKAV
jgi:hypothetical protein